MQQMIWKDTTTNTWIVNMDFKKYHEYVREYAAECKTKVQAWRSFQEADADHSDDKPTNEIIEKEIAEWDNNPRVRNRKYHDYSKPNNPFYLITTKEQWIDHHELLRAMDKSDRWAKLLAAQTVFKNFETLNKEK